MFDPKPHLIQLPRRVKDPVTGQWTSRLDDYLEVKWRLVWFRERYPHGTIETEELCIDLDRQYARFRAVVCDGEGGKATGYGTETAAGFADYVERAETRALGRALAALGIGTQFVGQDLTEGEHIVDAPVVHTTVESNGSPTSAMVEPPAGDPVPPTAARISRDQARELKQLAQSTFGYADGARQLRTDLAMAADEALTLRHLSAHVTVATFETLRARYDAHLRQQIEDDVPSCDPSVASPPVAEPPANGTEPAALTDAEERRRWGALSRRAMQAGVLPAVWESLHASGQYGMAETMIVALEGADVAGGGS